MSNEKFNAIIEIAKKHNITIFSDEVYRLLEYDEDDRLPNMCDCYDKGISLGVISKAFGLAGLRIGWIATKDISLLKKLMSFKNYTTICNSAPSEFFSTLALRNKDVILERNLKIIKENMRILDAFFNKRMSQFNWVKPKAGCIAFPMIKFSENVEEFCSDLFIKKGVLLLPGTKYDFDNKHFRIGFGRKNMPRGLKLLEEYLENL
jgi:aspartate/methionine/tyrosine aminotransferase